MKCNQLADFSTALIREATNREAKNKKQADLRKDIWYEISHEGEQHVPHGNLVTRHEVVSPMLNCFCSKLRSMFKETTTTSSSSSSSSSRSSSSSKRAAVLYYCKQ
jgi:hypothetical protein